MPESKQATTAFANYRDSIALLRATIPYKETSPDLHAAASAHCRAMWREWRASRGGALPNSETGGTGK